jgi:hypothetical protein
MYFGYGGRFFWSPSFLSHRASWAGETLFVEPAPHTVGWPQADLAVGMVKALFGLTGR